MAGVFVFSTSGAAGQKTLITNGLNVIAGGTGISDLILPAPKPGHRVTIRLATLTSGTVVVTTPTGVTMDGTNNTATFDAVSDTLTLVANGAAAWAIELNQSVTLSSV